MTQIGFIGVGHMGGPMVKNLLAKGHTVTAYDVVPEALDNVVQLGAVGASSLVDLVSDVDVVVSMLPAGEHVRDVYLGDKGILNYVHSDCLLIESSTIDVATSREVHAQADMKSLAFVDAPVSGGTAGAEAATLTFMVGGSEADFNRAKPILECMGKNIFHAGGAGNGQAAKICNNMLLGISMIGVCEAFQLGQKLGLDDQVFFDICSAASGQCWSLTSYCPVPGPVPTSPANNDYQAGFMGKMMLKDLRLSQEAGNQVNANTPLGAQATELYQQFCEAGLAEMDFSGIMTFLAEKS